MSRKQFNAGLLAGAALTIGVLAVIGLLTLKANAAVRIAAPDGETSASPASAVPRLGEVVFQGTVEQINGESCVVSGLTFRYDLQTMITPGLAVGDRVQVTALLLPDQTRYALSIQLLKSEDPIIAPRFEFYGIVESAGDAGWMISGETVQVNAETTIEAGVADGSLVEVEGNILEGSLVASKIHLEDAQKDQKPEQGRNEVEFKGVIELIDGDVYVIAGKTVASDASTEIKDVLAVGDLVKVHAALQSDGSYLAREIEREDSEDDEDEGDWQDSMPKLNKVKFKGLLESINGSTWVIAGRSVVVGAETKMKGNPQPGDLVEVEAFLQSDGTTLLAHEIEVEDGEDHDGDDSQNWDDDSHEDDDDDDDDDNDDRDHDRDDDDDDDHEDVEHWDSD